MSRFWDPQNILRHTCTTSLNQLIPLKPTQVDSPSFCWVLKLQGITRKALQSTSNPLGDPKNGGWRTTQNAMFHWCRLKVGVEFHNQNGLGFVGTTFVSHLPYTHVGRDVSLRILSKSYIFFEVLKDHETILVLFICANSPIIPKPQLRLFFIFQWDSLD